MKLSNKLQTLLTDLRDKLQHRQWHVRCLYCRWEVHNLDHERFARARGKNHHANHHDFDLYVVAPNFIVWSSRA